jgi:hypothetical protein
MAINPGIALGVQPAQPLDMLGAYGKAMSIKNLVDGAKLQQLQMTQAQRQMDNEDALRGAYVVGEDGMIDEKGTIQNLVRAGQGPQAMKMRHESDLHRIGLSKAEREAEKARFEMIGQSNKLIGQELAALGPNPTYATVMDAGLRLNQQGLQIDLNQIPEDPIKLLRFVNERKQRAMDVERQLAEWRAANEPKTELGKLLRDQAMFGGGMEGGNAAANRPLVGGATDLPGGGVRSPEVTGVPPGDPFAARIAREQYGAPGPFRYNNQGQLEGVPVVQEFERGKAKDSAAVTNISIRNENKEQEESSKIIGKGYGEQYTELQKAEFASRKRIGRAERLESLLDGVQTGKLTPMGTQLAGYAHALGFEIDPKLGNKEAAIALESEMALELRNPSGGAGMPGAMSDADRTFLQNMASFSNKTPQGRKFMLESYRAIAKRDADIARLARDYKKRNGGKFDEGFYDELAVWSERNPMFPSAAAIEAEKARRGLK